MYAKLNVVHFVNVYNSCKFLKSQKYIYQKKNFNTIIYTFSYIMTNEYAHPFVLVPKFYYT